MKILFDETYFIRDLLKNKIIITLYLEFRIIIEYCKALNRAAFNFELC